MRYRGEHPEPSFAWRPVPEGASVQPYGVYDGARSRRIESICLPQGVWRPVNPFAAVYLAAIRRRHGPWFDVRLAPGEWAMIRERAPWLRKARGARMTERPFSDLVVGMLDDAALLCDIEIAKGLYAMTMNRYEVVR